MSDQDSERNMAMSDRDSERNFEQRAKALFDDSVAGLDAATRSRLTQARHRALAEHGKARLFAPGARNWPLAAAGTLATVALAMWLAPWRAVPEPEALPPTAAFADLELLLGDELEMLEADLEFYAWLEEQPELAEGEDGIG